MHSQNIGAYLNCSDGVGSLLAQAARLLELRKRLADVLPEQLVRSCQIANYNEQGKVVIFAKNGAVAAKLGHFRPQLAAHLSGRGIEVTVIEIVVQVRPPEPVATAHAPQLSDAGRKSLAGLAAVLPDSPLKHSVNTMLGRRRG